MPADSSLTIFPLDHPRMARTLAGRIAARKRDLEMQLMAGNAEDWADYKQRIGVIRGLNEAIDIAGELEKELERN